MATFRPRSAGWLPAIALLFLFVLPASSRPKKIVVAFGESFPPMVYREHGIPVGADIQIWRRWSEETGVAVEFRLMPWPEAIPALIRGEVDVVDGVSRTPERESALDFSSAYGELRSFIYYDPRESGPLDLDDLRRIPTGVLAGSNTEEYLRGAAPNVALRTYESPTGLVDGLHQDEIDAFICVDLVTEYHRNRHRDSFPMARGSDALAASLLHMAVREGETELLALVNEGLAMVPEEERNEIFERWTGVPMGGGANLEWLLWLGGALFVAAILLSSWNAVLRRKFGRATRELREKELRFRELIESTSDWIWEIDTDGVYTYVGPTVRELLGLEPEEVMGRTPFDLMPKEEAERVRRIVMPLIEQGRPIENVENRNLTRNGRTVLLETSGVPIRDRVDNVVGYRGVDRDITERKSLETQLAHSQKMEAIGQLAGGVAHDFNNQLQAILGYTHLLLKQESPREPARTHLDEIRRAAERAAALTKQLLTFGRRETIQLRNIHLGSLVQRMTGLLERVLGEQVELAVRSVEDLWAVRIDPGQAEQVVMNLCINARDAMPEGGPLTIETANRSLGPADPDASARLPAGDYVLLTVRDGGTGIAPEIRDHIFEPFYTTKGVGKGTGLGLATVYAIVDRLQGRIDVESRAGEGATFRIFLPANHEAVDVDEVDETPEPEPGNETILVAEDEAVVRELTVEVLGEAGYRLLVAKDGHEAVERFDENRDEISLVILDMVMPGLGGREVHAHVRASHPDLPVLFCSGYSYSALKRGELMPRGGQLLPKPFTPAELLAKVRDLTDHGAGPAKT